MSKITDFKKKLARVFDNDLGTEQWGNILDYVIIGLIILSTLAVFVSTFNVSPTCEVVLHIVDIVTVIAFHKWELHQVSMHLNSYAHLQN